MLTVTQTLRDYYAASNKLDLPRTDWVEHHVKELSDVLHVDR
jgi:hypothetical protein